MHTVIEGVYYAVGFSPDADSIKFKANNPAHWDKIETDHRARFERELKDGDGVVTIRLEGIDALETHYTPPNIAAPKGLSHQLKKVEKPSKGDHKQPAFLGDAATTTFLDFLGITAVTWRTWGRNTWIDHATINGQRADDKFEDALPGYIITDDVERNGRPLGWVFTGEPPVPDGAQLSRQAVGELVPHSANYHLVARGTVYPFFYMALPSAIRIPLMNAAKNAQANPDQEDVWTHDKTINGIHLPSMAVLHDDTVIYPYLFRRIVRHWYTQTMTRFYDGVRQGAAELPDGSDLSLDLDGFFDEGDPWVFVVSQQDFLHLSDILAVERHSLRLHTYPYDIVFLS